MQNQEQKEVNFQLEAQLLINRFYELETDGQKMDYDTAVECAKVASKTIIESGNLLLPEDRLYWRCVLKQCDLFHSQEYLIASLKRDEERYNPTAKEGNENAIESEQVISIGVDKAKHQSFPTEKNWYLCRLNDPYHHHHLKLCYWNGEDWESMDNEKLPKGRVKRWQDLTSIQILASCFSI